MTKTNDRDTRLRLRARQNGGVVPVPFLGRTWQTRGGAYWRRRIGATALLLLLAVVASGIATGFTIGIVGDGHDVVRVVLGVLYVLTAIPGVRTGLRKIAEAPLDDRSTGLPRTFVPNGLLALIIAPYSAAAVITVFLGTFGRDFLGERAAREVTQQISRGGAPPGHSARR